MSEPQQASIWVRARRGARGPSPEHQLADIAAAAVDLADAGGLSAISMRAVAGAIGTTASTLYRYVASRDELLDLMTDSVMATFAYTADPEAAWLDELVRVAVATRALCVKHPWLMDIRQTRTAPGPHSLAWFEHCLRAIAPLDLPGLSKMEAIALLNGVVMLFARNQLAPPAYDLSAANPRRHPHLVDVLTNATPGAPSGDFFERTVRALLSGLLAGAD